MEQKIYLAYDGSINGDWVSRYAVNMAQNSLSRQLTLLHVKDGRFPIEKIRAKIASIAEECQSRGIEFTSQIAPISKNVYRTLVEIIPARPKSYCICGARITSRGKGFLAGTISEKLLYAKRFNVLAIRVVNPGILGCPADLLFPLAGHPRGFKAAMPFLMMLIPSIHRIHLFRTMKINSLWFQYLSGPGIQASRAIGREYLDEIIAEIKKETGEYTIHIDGEVVLSSDWAKEIIIKAGKERSGMILLGASDRFPPTRYFPGNRLEQVLRDSPCDVGIYRKI